MTTESFRYSDNYRENFILQFGSLGGLIGIFIIFFLLCHVLCNYIKTFHISHQQTQQRKSIHWLTILYLISGLSTCTIYAFIRSNIFTNLQFTTLQCNIGYFGGFFTISVNKILLYLVIIKRIKDSLKGSIYAYEPILFLFIYWAMSIFTSIGWILLIRSQSTADWTLVIAPDVKHRDIIYCNRTRSQRSIELMASHGILALGEIAMLIGLTYLFLKALWKLRVSILELHDASSQRNEPMDIAQRTRMERLDGIIKRQCILVGYAALSTLVIWSFAVYTFDAATWVCWDIMVHAVCVWMMTKNAERYWGCCKKYGFCCCCYWSKREFDGRSIVEMNNVKIHQDLSNGDIERVYQRKPSQQSMEEQINNDGDTSHTNESGDILYEE